MTSSRMDGCRDRIGGLAYGGDYNPEQWDPAVWREDVRLMREAGVNLFFQWRASRGGQERFHSAMLPHSGPDSRTFREVTALGREIKLLSPVAGTTMPPAEIAILFDWNGWWGLEEFTSVLLAEVAAAGVANRFIGLPAHLECTVREDEQHEYLFLLNHHPDEAATIPLDGRGTDLLTGMPIVGEITLAPLQAAVIQRPIS